MTWTAIAIAIALVVFVLARRVRGEGVPAPKKLFLFPFVVGAIGLQDLTHAKVNAVDIGVIAAGSDDTPCPPAAVCPLQLAFAIPIDRALDQLGVPLLR